ncbi:YbaB/EbfC family nucleoid-associated protein [Amycolatopsis sp. NPDC051372]
MDENRVLSYEPVAVERPAEEVRGIQRELAAVVEEAESGDGLVFVKVAARGDVVELDLAPR